MALQRRSRTLRLGAKVMTANELMANGQWEAYCEEHGINPWAVNEGLLDGDEEL